MSELKTMNNKSLKVLSLIVVSLLVVGMVYGQGDVKDSIHNVDDFLSLKGSDTQDRIINNNLNEFVEAVTSSQENMNKLVKGWGESEDGKYAISDNAKTKIFRALLKKDPEFASRLANSATDRLKAKDNGGVPDYNVYYKNPISVKIHNDLIDKVVWRENKFGIDEDGEFKAWIDLDRLPASTKEIELKKDEDGAEKFFVNVADEKSSVVLKFSEGGLDEDAYVLKKDGSRFGSPPLGVKSIKWDPKKKKVDVEYVDLNGKPDTLELEESDFRDASKSTFEMIKEAAKKKERYPDLDWDEILKKTELVEGKVKDGDFMGEVDKFLRDLGSIELNAPAANEISLGYRRMVDFENGEVEFKFTDNGGLKIITNGGGAIGGTDVSGETALFLEDDGEIDGGASFNFNQHGILESVEGGSGIVFDASGYQFVDFSSDELLKTHIARSSLAEALKARDFDKILAMFEQDSELFKQFLADESPDIKLKAIDFLRDQLGDEEMQVQVRGKISDVIQVVENDLEEITNKEINRILTSLTGDEEFVKHNPSVGFLLEKTEEEIREAIGSLTDKGNIETLLNYYSDPNPANTEKLSELVERTLNERAKGYESVFSSTLVEVINNKIEGFTGEIKKVNSDQVSKRIKEFVDEEVQSVLSRNKNEEDKEVLSSKLRKTLNNLPKDVKLSSSNVDDIVGGFESFITDVVAYKSKENKEKRQKIIKDSVLKLFEEEGRNGLVIDTQANEIIYSGNGNVVVDARQDSTVKVKDGDGGGVFILKNNGQDILIFDGDKTRVPTKPAPQSGSYVNMGLIVNENKEGNNRLVFEAGSSGGYELYDPTSPGRVKKATSYGHVTAIIPVPIIDELHIPILASKVQIQRTESIGDIGTDPNAAITIKNIAQGQRTGFGSRIINSIVDKKASGKSQDLGKMVGDIKGELNKEVIDRVAKKTTSGFVGDVENGQWFLDFTRDNGVALPSNVRQELEDQLYLGSLIAEDIKAAGPNAKPGDIKYTKFIGAFDPLIEFLSTQSLRHYETLTFRNNYIDVGGNRIGTDQINQRILRTFMRQLAANPGRLTKHKFVDGEGNEIK